MYLQKQHTALIVYTQNRQCSIFILNTHWQTSGLKTIQTCFCAHVQAHIHKKLQYILWKKMEKLNIIWYDTWSSHYDSCKLMPNRKAFLHFKWITMTTGWKQLGLKLFIIRNSFCFNSKHTILFINKVRWMLNVSIKMWCTAFFFLKRNFRPKRNYATCVCWPRGYRLRSLKKNKNICIFKVKKLSKCANAIYAI